MTSFSESEVEQLALDWLAGLGWTVAHGPDIAPGTPDAERDGYDQVILERRLADAIDRLNADLPSGAREDAQGAIKIAMTGSASDPLEWQQHILALEDGKDRPRIGRSPLRRLGYAIEEQNSEPPPVDASEVE